MAEAEQPVSYLLVSFQRAGCHLGCEGVKETFAVPWKRTRPGFEIYGYFALYDYIRPMGALPDSLSDLQQYLPKKEHFPIEDRLESFMTGLGAISLNVNDFYSRMKPQTLGGDVVGMVSIGTLL